MPLTTWLGLAQDPGELDGYGPIPAALARQIAADAARDHPRTTTWRCVPLDDRHRTVLGVGVGVGDTIPTPRHDPTPRQRDLVIAADPTCVWPGCGKNALRCDIDHRIPYQDGGPTCPCNLQPLCRRHHRMKGTGLIQSTPAAGPDTAVPVGSLDWATWTGRTYRHSPEPAAEAPLTAHEHHLIRAARLRRALDDAGQWADPDNPENDTPNAGLRARLRDLAAGFRIAGPADHDPTTPETSTGIENWQYAIRRHHHHHHDRETQAATRRATQTTRANRTELATDLHNDCPF
jgi:hypothetical protein